MDPNKPPSSPRTLKTRVCLVWDPADGVTTPPSAGTIYYTLWGGAYPVNA